MAHDRYEPKGANRTYNEFGILEQQNKRRIDEEGYTKAEVDALLEGKVDVEEGKGLSTNDYDDTEKEKVSTHDTEIGALQSDVNAIEGRILSIIENKAEKDDVYTKDEVDGALENKADKSDVYTKDEIDTSLEGKVNIEAGKGLSSNDFTDEYKGKIDENVERIEEVEEGKQDKLIAGDGIGINKEGIISVKFDGTTIKLNSRGFLYVCGGHGGKINIGNIEGGCPESIYMEEQIIDGGYPETKYNLEDERC